MSLSLRMVANALGGQVIVDQVSAPGPGHSRTDRSLTVWLSPNAPEGFRVHSHAGDDWRVCRDYVIARLGLAPHSRRSHPHYAVPPRRESVDNEALRARGLAHASRIVADLVPIAGTAGEAYLRDTRDIGTSAIQDVLERVDAIGWHPSVYFNDPNHAMHRQRLGCIVGIMTDPLTARPTGAISRTYITSDLMKIGTAKTLGAPAGLVRLSPDDEVLAGLCIAEGLETALRAMSIGLRPVWSTGSTSLMSSFPALSGIEALRVIVDHDANGAGERAAREVERRWLGAGRAVDLRMRDKIGDLDDAFRGGGS